ncbi:MAG: ATP-dependent DNA helicase RecG, partial [Lachnospiraceae bacterium]|nr:ATP-dependent DNA helicase RecG [Lachnospiraceae bacterium]
MKKSDPIGSLKGVGSKTALLFQKLHIETVEDLLMYFPRDYEVYEKPVTLREAVSKSAANNGASGIVSVYGRIKKGVVLKKKGNLTIAITSAEDIDGREFTLVWYNAPFVRTLFHANDTFIFRGRISELR